MISEQDLLQRARQFDRQTLGDIYDRYSPAIYRYAARLLGHPNLAEECVAEVFSRFLRTLQWPPHLPSRLARSNRYNIARSAQCTDQGFSETLSSSQHQVNLNRFCGFAQYRL